MLIKSADDKSKLLALLEDLQKSSLLDNRQKDWLRDELRNLNAGIKGERAAAFYLDGHYKDGQNNVLLHDLRLQVDGEVAQIDHLVINRTGYMVLIETKTTRAIWKSTPMVGSPCAMAKTATAFHPPTSKAAATRASWWALPKLGQTPAQSNQQVTCTEFKIRALKLSKLATLFGAQP
ncbi:nuclease-related domain-containing protein [Rhodoferax saidenbachensis]|uniref:NERD domain-containing protein n=1 Tax=Rhodoferax saidenbachensis TaxID=1484693 RepID=A0ABU1ZQU4_9BURK|nr:nuclease-related domain-containing protein [Rhodoferax saidenbachensis]MDR7307905.1 hypothetical protein [Rhodoferax saidenbachensis]